MPCQISLISMFATGTALAQTDTDNFYESNRVIMEKNAGDIYGEASENFIRINITCPRSLLIEGLKRLQYIASLV